MKTITINSLKRVTTKAGKRRVLINGTEFISEGQFNQAMPQGLSDTNLIGSHITIEYFQKGEELVNGEECSEGGKLVKGVSIAPSLNAQIASSVAASILASFGQAPVSQSAPVVKQEVKVEAKPATDTSDLGDL
jgi:hypothetical protein